MSEEPKSITDLCTEFFDKELESGYQITDRNTVMNLRKKCMTELHIKSGSKAIAQEALDKVMKKRGIKVSIPTKSGGGIDAKFDKPLIPQQTPESKPTLPQSTSTEQPQSPRGSLPKQETETTKATFIPNPQDKEKQQKLAEVSIGGIIEIIYEKMGILEPKPKPKTPEEKTSQSEELRTKVISFSNKLGGVLYDNGIKLPAVLQYVEIGVEGFQAVVQPIVSKLFSQEDTEPEKPEEKPSEELKNVT